MFERLKKQSLKKILIMSLNIIRMLVIKLINKSSRVSLIQNLHPTTEIIISKKGKISLSHSVFTRRNVSFRVESGTLSIGTSFFNQGCMVTAMNCITIGENCLFGPNVVIVDHDHDYSYLDNRRGNHYKTKQVIIGRNVWVGANVTILKGSTLGDNCVIGAGSVVRGNVPADSLFISTLDNKIRKIEQEENL